MWLPTSAGCKPASASASDANVGSREDRAIGLRRSNCPTPRHARVGLGQWAN